MINIIIEISAYIFAAIVLGYFFGWLSTRVVLTKRYQTKLDEIILNKETSLDDVDIEKDSHLKDEEISTLNNKLKLMEEKLIAIENKYEKEIDAFLSERIDLIEKYKTLLVKADAI